jgi:hypothetical protein
MTVRSGLSGASISLRIKFTFVVRRWFIANFEPNANAGDGRGTARGKGIIYPLAN